MRIEFTLVGGNQINYSDSLAQISMILSFSGAFFSNQVFAGCTTEAVCVRLTRFHPDKRLEKCRPLSCTVVVHSSARSGATR